MRDLVRRKMCDVVPVEHDRAFARTRIAEDRHHEGRLTGAIRTDQRDDLAVRNIEVNIPQRLNLSVKRGDAAHGEEWSGHRRPLLPPPPERGRVGEGGHFRGDPDNLAQHAIKVAVYVVIPKPNQSYSICFEPLRASFVPLSLSLVIVLTAIEFDR